MGWKMLKMTNCVAEFLFGVVQQAVKPILNRLVVVQPLKPKKPPVPFRVIHNITKLIYINKNLAFLFAITSILMYKP